MYVFSVAIWFNVCFMDISHDFSFLFFFSKRKENLSQLIGDSPSVPNTGSSLNTGHVWLTTTTIKGYITFVFTHVNLCL